MVYKLFIKPVVDFFVALIGLMIISPLFILITILLTISNRGTPFFVQKRPGKSGKIFKVIKFKTMNDRRDPEGNLLPDSKRLTKIGRILRRTSLDEIPQLINVIKGNMSFIGPRPLLVEYIPLYNKKQARRHEVRPGITGWAQVNGRNSMLFSKRFENDVWYVDNISFKLDIKIVFLTLRNVITSKGVINGQNVTDVDDLNFNKK